MDIKFNNFNIKLCKGLQGIFKTKFNNTGLQRPFVGWYDPTFTADTSGNTPVGDVMIFYWNGLIDKYNPSGGPFNDYSLQSYLLALNNMLITVDKRVIVDLPVWDVSGNYGEQNLLIDWWEQIINNTKNHQNVIGYYLFDEPEVWGYFNSIPELTHSSALSFYQLAKQYTTKDIYSVFNDITLFNQKYGGQTPFWDVFMFDAYDFLEQSVLDTRCSANPVWCYTAGSQDERNYVEQRLLNWKTQVITPYNYNRVVFVMQGHGNVRQDPVTGATTTDPAYVFGMRTMTADEYNFIVNILKTQFNLEGVLAWSWFFANDTSRQRANTALLTYKN